MQETPAASSSDNTVHSLHIVNELVVTKRKVRQARFSMTAVAI